MLDRTKVLNWWVGRFSDQELADWTGMAPRAVGIVLSLPTLRHGVIGGGRGSKNTRRVMKASRNAVGIVAALNQAGITFEQSANLIGTCPEFASAPTAVVDYEDPYDDLRSLSLVDPKGGWLPDDVVPRHIWERQVVRCRRRDNPDPIAAETIYIPVDQLNPSALSAHDLVPITGEVEYGGEIDPLGFYLVSSGYSKADRRTDDHLLIFDGKWVFYKKPTPWAWYAMQARREEPHIPRPEPTFDVVMRAILNDDKKTVSAVDPKQYKNLPQFSDHIRDNFRTCLDVNTTLSVRKMKRKALGLPA